MIQYPTVFVLGAGASYPYGFPLGFELRDMICSSRISGNIRQHYGSHKFDAFVKSFERSNISSIDSYLSRRPEYVEIGKVVIAEIISKKENPNHNAQTDDWYKHLWNKLIEDIPTIDDFPKNQVKVITFNYDRSLEFYLIRSIMNSFNVNFPTALSTLRHIPIIHFYGSLGNIQEYPGEYVQFDEGCLPYRNDHELGVIFNASKNIKIMHEDRDDKVNSSTIDEWFKWARNIMFLGFGYDSLNIKRLGLREVLENNYAPSQYNKFILGSSYELTLSEANVAGRRLTGETFISSWKTINGKNVDTIRHFAEILS